MSLVVGDRELRRIPLLDRPLIVCDIDEVALEFVTPFTTFLATRGYELIARSFRLTGNIVSRTGGGEAGREAIAALQEEFYASQADYQLPAPGAEDALKRLSASCDIVFLTAMPPRHAEARRALLDRHGLAYPMIATEEAKGPLVGALHRNRALPAVFLDDIFTNLHSVRTHLPSALLINLIANADFRALAPDPGNGIVTARDWSEAEGLIRQHIGSAASAGAAGQAAHGPA